jgi:hypothetical protein
MVRKEIQGLIASVFYSHPYVEKIVEGTPHRDRHVRVI